MIEDLFSLERPTHCYYLFATGIKMKPRYFRSRKEATIAMSEFCAKNGIVVECTECDKHEREYAGHAGIRFYINRV